jgi:hypothetical protein
MKGKFRVVGIILGILACIVGFASYLGFDAKQSVLTKDGAAYNVQAEIEKSYETEGSKLNMVKYELLGDGGLVQEVHDMTHQKVYAKQKWGSSEITADKVQKLYEVVMENEFETKEMLLEILEPWTSGDFSNAVRAHNEIWSYQGGTIGKASRLLTPEEELAYIEKHFR